MRHKDRAPNIEKLKPTLKTKLMLISSPDHHHNSQNPAHKTQHNLVNQLNRLWRHQLTNFSHRVAAESVLLSNFHPILEGALVNDDRLNLIISSLLAPSRTFRDRFLCICKSRRRQLEDLIGHLLDQDL